MHVETCIEICINVLAGSDLPSCSTPSSYLRAAKVADDLFFYGQWNPSECQCDQPCLKLLFTSSLEATTDKYNKKRGVNRARVRIYYQVHSTERPDETHSGNSSKLISDEFYCSAMFVLLALPY